MRFFGKSKGRISVNMSIGLTESGRRKAEEIASGGPKFEILATLREQGSCTIHEIGEETHMSPNVIQHHVKQLQREGHVRYVGGED